MAYPFKTWTEDGVHYMQAYPPMDNVLTYGEDAVRAAEEARDALSGVLGALQDAAEVIPEPPRTVDDAAVWVEPHPRVAVPVLIRKARLHAHLTQLQLAERLGVTYQAVQKWERTGTNPTVATLDRVLEALGYRLSLQGIEEDAAAIG